MVVTTGRRPSSDDIRAFVGANLPLRPVPGCPELSLHLARPSSGLRRLAARDEAGFGSPYWAYPWPGGLGLARHVLDHPHLVCGRRVLDLGAGSGLVAIAAAKAGAAAVQAAEIDPYAVAVLALNAEANGVALDIIAEDVTRAPPPAVDLVLVGDLFYEAGLAKRVTDFLHCCRGAGLDVLIGDVGRPCLPQDLLRKFADYPVREFGTAARETRCGVFAFAP